MNKAAEDLYNVTFIIHCISFAVIARILFNCIILKTSTKNSTIFLNIIEIKTTNNTKNAKIIFKLKDIFIF